MSISYDVFAQLLARIDDIGRQLRSIRESGDLSLRVPDGGNDEVAALAKGINGMLELSQSEVEAAFRAKKEFLANISHEIRTPMNGILGMTRLALGTQLNDEQREYIDAAHRSADQLLEVINDILDFSTIEAQRMVLSPSEFNLQESVAEIISKFSVQAEIKGLKMNLSFDPELPASIIADRERFSQILRNLVSNAVKFTGKGEITISIGIESKHSDTLRLKMVVSDTGIGIVDKKQEEIFVAFMQADGSSTRKFGGTGLGLAIASSLASMMNGEITLSSKNGEGSTFIVTIEVGTAESARSRAETNSSQTYPCVDDADEFTGMKILLAEDGYVNQELAVCILKKWGCEVDAVDNGRKAFEAAANKQYDLVLMDINMPEMNGLDASRAIRLMEESNGGHLPIIALTASTLPCDQQLCYEAGMDAFTLKPISVDDLRNAIKSTLNRTPVGTGEQKEFQLLDPEKVLVNLGGDMELLAKIAQAFCEEEADSMLGIIKKAIESRDSENLYLTAHRLKGTVGNFGAEKARSAAYALEMMGREGRIDASEDAYKVLDSEIQALKYQLVSFITKEAA